MIDFKSRVIELTSEKITLSSEYDELKRVLDSTSFGDRSRVRITKRLLKRKQALEHLEQNLRTNIYLSQQ